MRLSAGKEVLDAITGKWGDAFKKGRRDDRGMRAPCLPRARLDHGATHCAPQEAARFPRYPPMMTRSVKHSICPGVKIVMQHRPFKAVIDKGNGLGSVPLFYRVTHAPLVP